MRILINKQNNEKFKLNLFKNLNRELYHFNFCRQADCFVRMLHIRIIVTRKDCNIISDCTVSDFISDHRVLHTSLQCIRPHSVRKQITVRAPRWIKDDALAEDLDMFNVDQGCVDVDIMIEQYDKYLSDLLDNHAPKSINMW